jgi:hypothetical protein
MVIAIILIYRSIINTNEQMVGLRNEVIGQMNKLSNHISQFAETIRTTTNDNIEQLIKINHLNNQLGDKKKGKSNILLISDTADRDDSYCSSNETSEDNIIDNNIVFHPFNEKNDSTNESVEKTKEQSVEEDTSESEEIKNKTEDKNIETNEPKNELNNEPEKEQSDIKKNEQIEKPKEEKEKIKNVEEYKLSELRDLAKELKISIVGNKEGEKQRYLNKNELYEKIKNFSSQNI